MPTAWFCNAPVLMTRSGLVRVLGGDAGLGGGVEGIVGVEELFGQLVAYGDFGTVADDGSLRPFGARFWWGAVFHGLRFASPVATARRPVGALGIEALRH